MTASASWAPSPALVAVGWLAAVAAGAFVVLTDEPPGRVLLGAAAVALAVVAAHGTLARPRLAADQDGVTVRGLTRRRRWNWPEVRIRVMRVRRLGREVATLELEAGDDLVVLGWLDLGAHPDEVAETLAAVRP